MGDNRIVRAYGEELWVRNIVPEFRAAPPYWRSCAVGPLPPLRRMLFYAMPSWNDLKEICTRRAKAIYMACALFFFFFFSLSPEQQKPGEGGCNKMHEPRDDVSS
jgi:hypothetical protein